MHKANGSLQTSGNHKHAIHEINIKNVSDVAGAEILNVNLQNPLTKPVLKEIMEALIRHHVLIFRGQSLSKIQQETFTRNFGEIEGHVGRLPNGQRLPIVHTVTNVDSSTGIPTVAPHTDGNYYWHTDKSYHDVPSLMTMLHAIDIPPEGGDTLFCNMHMAYESLPKEKQKFFSNLRAVHSWEASRRNTGNIPATEEQKRERPPVSHPIVRTHPETNRKSLYLGMHTSHIEGIAEAKGKRMLDELLDAGTVTKNIYRHSWKSGDLVIWDNRCLLHRADRNFKMGKYRRILHRTVVKGTVPF